MRTQVKTVKFADAADGGTLVQRLGSSVFSKGDAKNRNVQHEPSKKTLSSRDRHRRRKWRRFLAKMRPRYWILVLNRKLPILHPDSPGRRAWDLYVLTLVIYTSLVVPFQVGFGNIEGRGVFIMDRLVDASFWVDICINFRTAYVDVGAVLIRDGGAIATNYLKTWFGLDLAASIPYDIVLGWFMSDMSEESLIALGLLRTPRLLRLGRLLRFFDKMRGVNIVRMGKLLFIMALVAHWVTCMWFMLYRLTRHSMRWSFDLIPTPNPSTMTYFVNTYLCAFQLMIGNDVDPQNNMERAYCTFILVIGACYFAIVIGHMSLLVNNMNPTQSRHHLKKDIINNTVRYLKAPPRITARINEYFDYLSTYSHPGPDSMALIGTLPSSMFQDIASWMYRDLVTKVPLFQGCEPAFVTQLVVRLRMAVFLPGEVIFRVGDVGHEVYFISKGFVSVQSESGEMLALLERGGYFGEIALLATARRTAQCAALCHCDLTFLSVADLVAAMTDFPESAKKVRAHVIKRLTEMQIAGQVRRGAADGQDSDDDSDFDGDDGADRDGSGAASPALHRKSTGGASDPGASMPPPPPGRTSASGAVRLRSSELSPHLRGNTVDDRDGHLNSRHDLELDNFPTSPMPSGAVRQGTGLSGGGDEGLLSIAVSGGGRLGRKAAKGSSGSLSPMGRGPSTTDADSPGAIISHPGAAVQPRDGLGAGGGDEGQAPLRTAASETRRNYDPDAQSVSGPADLGQRGSLGSGEARGRSNDEPRSTPSSFEAEIVVSSSGAAGDASQNKTKGPSGRDRVARGPTARQRAAQRNSAMSDVEGGHARGAMLMSGVSSVQRKNTISESLSVEAGKEAGDSVSGGGALGSVLPAAAAGHVEWMLQPLRPHLLTESDCASPLELSAETLQIVQKVNTAVERLNGRMVSLKTKMTAIRKGLRRMEADPSILGASNVSFVLNSQNERKRENPFMDIDL